MSCAHFGTERCYSPDCYWSARISHKKLGKILVDMINFMKRVELLQKSGLLETARIIRKVLDFAN